MNYGLKKCPAVSSDLAILSKLNTRSGWGNIYRKPRLPVTLPSTSLISNKKRYNTWFPSKSIDFKYIKKNDLKIWFSRLDLPISTRSCLWTTATLGSSTAAVGPSLSTSSRRAVRRTVLPVLRLGMRGETRGASEAPGFHPWRFSGWLGFV